MTTYIVASDAARARIFAHDHGALREIETLVHPESQQHTGDLRTGSRGEQGGGGATRSQRQTGSDDATPQKHAALFAKEVAEFLRQARTQGRADSFVLIAEPQFLGALRQKLDAPTRDQVVKEIDKNLSRADEGEIAKALGGDMRS